MRWMQQAKSKSQRRSSILGWEAAKEKGSGLSKPIDGEESSSVPCLAWKKKIDAEANVVLAPERSSFPPDEVDATGKNKSKS